MVLSWQVPIMATNYLHCQQSRAAKPHTFGMRSMHTICTATNPVLSNLTHLVWDPCMPSACLPIQCCQTSHIWYNIHACHLHCYLSRAVKSHTFGMRSLHAFCTATNPVLSNLIHLVWDPCMPSAWLPIQCCQTSCIWYEIHTCHLHWYQSSAVKPHTFGMRSMHAICTATNPGLSTMVIWLFCQSIFITWLVKCVGNIWCGIYSPCCTAIIMICILNMYIS